MASEITPSEIRSKASQQSTDRWLRYGRPLSLAIAVVFLISSVFPLVAGLSKNTQAFPKLWGVLDIGIAFFLGILVFVLLKLAQGQVTRPAEDLSFRIYRIMNHGILVLCFVFIFGGDRILWVNCITGFAWRTWLLVFCLPAWIAARSTPRSFH